MTKTNLAVLMALAFHSIGVRTGYSQLDYIVYGTTFFNNELIRIDPATGQGALVGSLGASVSPFGLANRNGSFFTYNPNLSRIQPIDLATGQAGSGIDIGLSGVQGEGDIAFSPNGAGFLFAALDGNFNVVNNLYTFDIAAGTSVRIGSSAQSLDGLAFVGNLLYATAQGDPTLYLVNQSDASLSAVGSLGINPQSPVQGLTAAPEGGLFGAIDDRLYRIDTLTGFATAVDPNVLDIGFSSVSGLAVIPEPTGAPLLIVGMIAFMYARMRAKSHAGT